MHISSNQASGSSTLLSYRLTQSIKAALRDSKEKQRLQVWISLQEGGLWEKRGKTETKVGESGGEAKEGQTLRVKPQ